MPMSALAAAQFIDPSDPVLKQSEITLKKTMVWTVHFTTVPGSVFSGPVYLAQPAGQME
jgi:hypothetical protein